MQNCNICPRNCNVCRDQKLGFCGADNNLKIAKVMLHQWEEPLVSGNDKNRGSGAIFFSHCSLKCCFCQNWEISNGKGQIATTDDLVDIFKKLEEAGAYNINLVSPTHFTNQIIDALDKYKPNIPIVWNTSGYETVQNIQKLKDYVDIFLTDLKYKDPKLSLAFSGAKDYFDFASKALLQMIKNQPKDISKDGILQKGVIIRHLVLPNCTNDTLDILDWLAENVGTNHIISVMSQYLPCYKAKQNPLLCRKLKPIEYKRVLNRIQSLGFENGFVQDFESSCQDFIPDFETPTLQISKR